MEIKTINTSSKPLPRMRVAAECFKMIKHEDPASRISLHYIRQLSNSGAIPTVKSGNRLLINYDKLIEYLNHPHEQPVTYGMIRRVTD